MDDVDFTALLDHIKDLIDGDIGLRGIFLGHALNQINPRLDPVALEIAAEVTDLWDRRKQDHPGAAWVKNPSTFVAHVYKKWLDAGTLKQVHLKQDLVLYRRYAKHISTRPQDDLNLTKSSAGRPPFIHVLDQIKTAVEQDSELRAAFDAHALIKGPARLDPIALEISAEVTDLWDRRKLDHPGEPWIKNPMKFVSHVYKKWLDAGTLKQIHLKHDPALYQRYAEHISQTPTDDLGLAKSPSGPRHSPQQGPDQKPN